MLLRSQQAWISMSASHMQQTGRSKAIMLFCKADMVCSWLSPCHVHRSSRLLQGTRTWSCALHKQKNGAVRATMDRHL